MLSLFLSASGNVPCRFAVDARLSLQPDLVHRSRCRPSSDGRRQSHILRFGIWLIHLSADWIKHQYDGFRSCSQRSSDARVQCGHKCR